LANAGKTLLGIHSRLRAPVSTLRFQMESAVKRLPSIIACYVILLLSPQGQAADLGSLVSSVKLRIWAAWYRR
jgi:hypothetical protein